MYRTLAIAALLYLAGPSSAQTLGQAESSTIAEAVGTAFADIADATNTLDVDRILAHHDSSDALTYVALGRIARGRAAFKAVLDRQIGGLLAADVRFVEPVVDVLGRDAAIVTSHYELTATLPSGDRITTSGTYTCLFVLRGGRWLIRHSSHTIPRQ